MTETENKLEGLLKNKYHAYISKYGVTATEENLRKLDSTRAIVIDTGSSITKVGFANDSHPKVTFPSAVSHVNGRVYVGEDALKIGQPNYPIKHGIV